MNHPSFRLIEESDGNGNVLFRTTEIMSISERVPSEGVVSTGVRSYSDLKEEVRATLKEKMLQHMKQVLIVEGAIEE